MPFFCPEFGAPASSELSPWTQCVRRCIISEPWGRGILRNLLWKTGLHRGIAGITARKFEACSRGTRTTRAGKISRRSYLHRTSASAGIIHPQHVAELATMGNTGGLFPWSNGHGWDTRGVGDRESATKPFVAWSARVLFSESRQLQPLLAKTSGRPDDAGREGAYRKQPADVGVDMRSRCVPNPGVAGPDRAFTPRTTTSGMAGRSRNRSRC